MFYIGIDPGTTGAIAILAGQTSEVFDMQDPGILDKLRWLQNMPVKAMIEQVHSMPKQGVSTTFKFGKEYGRAVGWLEANSIPFEYATPAKWWNQVRDSGCGNPKTTKAKKEAALDLARRIFPKLSTRLARKKDHNRAEALLIAEALRRKDEK